MRLWTVHPQHLDSKGLVAAWREALLAQAVLAGATKGYRHHPQLARFRAEADPAAVMAAFLAGLADEADRRGYRFDRTKIAKGKFTGRLEETDGQLLYEWTHLRAKLKMRAPAFLGQFRALKIPKPHPLFRITPGLVREWERR